MNEALQSATAEAKTLALAILGVIEAAEADRKPEAINWGHVGSMQHVVAELTETLEIAKNHAS